MAKERIVNTKFWTDDYVLNLNPKQKLLFLYLITNMHTDICGIYELPRTHIPLETGLEHEEIAEILDKFEHDNKAIYRNGWMRVINFANYQRNNPKVKKGIELGLSRVPKIINDSLYIDYNSLSHPNSNLNPNPNSNSNPNINPESEELPLPEIIPLSLTHPEEMQKLWAATWGRNPKIPEQEETEKLIQKFGAEKVKLIFKQGSLKNFKNFDNFLNSLDENGNIKPLGNNNGNDQQNSKGTVKSRTDYKPDPSKYNKRIEELKLITGESQRV